MLRLCLTLAQLLSLEEFSSVRKKLPAGLTAGMLTLTRRKVHALLSNTAALSHPPHVLQLRGSFLCHIQLMVFVYVTCDSAAVLGSCTAAACGLRNSTGGMKLVLACSSGALLL
jgi:hypothetical protein